MTNTFPNPNSNLVQPQTRVTITPDQLIPVICESCKGEIFTQGFMLRELPALLSPTGESKLAPVPVFICLNCKEVLQTALPEALKKKKIVL